MSRSWFYTYLWFVFLLITLMGATLISACSESKALEEPASYEVKTTYSLINDKVLTPYCLACHTGGARDLSTYDSLMRYVEVGDPDLSKLCYLVRSGAMPPKNPIPSVYVEALCNWIREGAPRS